MTVRVDSDGAIALSGQCGVEDAEVLQRLLLAAPGSTVKWSDCEHLHAAVLQVLLVGKAPVGGAPKSAFLRDHVAPIVGRQSEPLAMQRMRIEEGNRE